MDRTNGLIRLKSFLRRTSLFTRIAIGNALVIVTGAFFGTILTRQFSSILDGWLISGFALIGISLSLVVNFLILRAALKPLRELRRLADQILKGDLDQLERINNPDLDTGNLYTSLQTLLEQLDKQNRQLHALSERNLNLQEDERKSIARSLHDDTGQALTMLIFNLDKMETLIPSEKVEIINLVSNTRELASNALTELRRIVFGLRPAILDDLGLASAIRWYARSNLEKVGIKVDLQAIEPLPELSPKISTTLFRIAQEGINNIVRHSKAQNVLISIVVESDQVIFHLSDDGKGFEPVTLASNKLDPDHLGLVGLRERVALLGGIFHLKSDPGHGVSLEVTLPLG
ncbi:histidine kinase [Chloroflexota bacterium]